MSTRPACSLTSGSANQRTRTHAKEPLKRLNLPHIAKQDVPMDARLTAPADHHQRPHRSPPAPPTDHHRRPHRPPPAPPTDLHQRPHRPPASDECLPSPESVSISVRLCDRWSVVTVCVMPSWTELPFHPPVFSF